jgi:hypothetical protein
MPVEMVQRLGDGVVDPAGAFLIKLLATFAATGFYGI